MPALAPGGRPQVSRIEAAFYPDRKETEYQAEVTTIGQEATVTSRWSGPNCGTWGPQGDRQATATEGIGLRMFWSHPHPPCAATTNHSDVLVVLTVSNSKGTTVCVYQGSESGTGPDCKPL